MKKFKLEDHASYHNWFGVPVIFAPIWLIGINTIVATFIAFLDEWHFLFELATHFRLQYFFSAIFCGIIFFFNRKVVALLVMLVVAGVNGIYIVPWYFSDADATAQIAEQKIPQPLKVISANVLSSNTEHEKLLSLIELESPDLIALMEVNQAWTESLSVLKPAYPYQKEVPREDNFGIAVYSRFPLSELEVKDFGGSFLPSIEGKVIVNEKPITVVATHPLPPISPMYYQRRNDQINAVATYMAGIDGPKILMGDFNVTMWSKDYQPLVSGTGLRNASQGFGIAMSWPIQIPLLMIPIDHCFVSDDIQVAEMKTAGSIGADHLPLVVTLEI